MDPITTAIVAALSAGVGSGMQKFGESVLVDAYNSLKETLKKKFGSESDVTKSVEGLEAKPESNARREMLKEEIAMANADQDPEILEAAQELLAQLKAQPNGEQHIQNAVGNYIAQADRGSTASVNINHPQE